MEDVNDAAFLKYARGDSDQPPSTGPISAEAIRQAALSTQRPCLSLLGIDIVGELNLRDCRADHGAPLPAIELTECIFAELIDISGAFLSRLSLKGSRLPQLLGRGCSISGELDISSIRSSKTIPGVAAPDNWKDESDISAFKNNSDAHPNQPQCHVCLPDARIKGSILAAGAELVAPPKRPSFERPEYALNLANAEVGGNLELWQGACALGGVRLPRSVGGNVILRGTKLVAAEDTALAAQLVKIEGFVDLRKGGHNEDKQRFEALGMVDFLRAEIRGGIVFNDAHLVADGDQPTLQLTDTICLGRLYLKDLEVDGSIAMANMQVFEVTSSRDENRPVQASSIVANNLRVSGNFDLNATCGAIWLSRASIAGNFALRMEPTPRFENPQAHLDNAICRGKLEIEGLIGTFDGTNLQVDGDASFMVWIKNPLDLRRLKTNGDLTFGAVQLDFLPPGINCVDTRMSIWLDDAEVKGELRWGRIDVADDWLSKVVRNPKNIIGARVGRLPWTKNAELIEIAIKVPADAIPGDRSNTPSEDLAIEVALISTGGRPRFLYQTGLPIHMVNQESRLQLQRKHAATYLEFFCGYMSGDAGPFQIVDPRNKSVDAGVRKQLKKISIKTGVDGNFETAGSVLFAGQLFNANFRIDPTGVVEMVGDQPLALTMPYSTFLRLSDLSTAGAQEQRRATEPLARKLTSQTTAKTWKPDPHSPANRIGMKELSAERAAELLRAALNGHIIGLRNAAIGTIKEASVPTVILLDEPTGKVNGRWAAVKHDITGLTFTRSELSAVRAQPKIERGKLASKGDDSLLKKWLGMQFDDEENPSAGHGIAPQPYETLAKTFLAQGDVEAYGKAIRLRNQHLRSGWPWSYKLLSLTWERLFGNGMSLSNTLITVVGCLILVGLLAAGAAQSGALVEADPKQIALWSSNTPPKTCEAVDTVVFAVEAFVPLLGEKEEGCAVPPSESGWQIVFFLIKLLGWIIVPLAIYAATRAVRLQFERTAS